MHALLRVVVNMDQAMNGRQFTPSDVAAVIMCSWSIKSLLT